MNRPRIRKNEGLPANQAAARKKKKDSRYAIVLFIACGFGGLFISGWSKVLIGIGIAPVETIAVQIGIAVVAFVSSLLITRVVAPTLEKIPFNTVWGASAVFVMALMLAGQQRFETGGGLANDAALCRDAVTQEQLGRVFSACLKAAKQGDAGAQFYLGAMFRNRGGASHDYQQAFRWLTLSAAQGNAEAQFFLGEMLYEGLGIAQDLTRAHMWFSLAAANGDSMSGAARDIAAKEMTREQIAQAQQMSRECAANNYKDC